MSIKTCAERRRNECISFFPERLFNKLSKQNNWMLPEEPDYNQPSVTLRKELSNLTKLSRWNRGYPLTPWTRCSFPKKTRVRWRHALGRKFCLGSLLIDTTDDIIFVKFREQSGVEPCVCYNCIYWHQNRGRRPDHRLRLFAPSTDLLFHFCGLVAQHLSWFSNNFSLCSVKCDKRWVVTVKCVFDSITLKINGVPRLH